MDSLFLLHSVKLPSFFYILISSSTFQLIGGLEIEFHHAGLYVSSENFQFFFLHGIKMATRGHCERKARVGSRHTPSALLLINAPESRWPICGPTHWHTITTFVMEIIQLFEGKGQRFVSSDTSHPVSAFYLGTARRRLMAFQKRKLEIR